MEVHIAITLINLDGSFLESIFSPSHSNIIETITNKGNILSLSTDCTMPLKARKIASAFGVRMLLLQKSMTKRKHGRRVWKNKRGLSIRKIQIMKK